MKCQITKDYYIIVSYFKTIQFDVDFIFAVTASLAATSTGIKATASSMYRIKQF
jgi:hypothetical protein